MPARGQAFEHVVKALAQKPRQTVPEIADAAKVSRGRAAEILAFLVKAALATSTARAKEDPSKRGKAPLEYVLVKRPEVVLMDAAPFFGNGHEPKTREERERIDAARRAGLEKAHATRRRKAAIYVLVRPGTNMVVKPKELRMALRVRGDQVEEEKAKWEKAMGAPLEAMPLEEYVRTYYPETRGGRLPWF